MATDRRRFGERRQFERRVNPGASIDVTRHEHENLFRLVEELARRLDQLEKELRSRLDRIERDRAAAR